MNNGRQKRKTSCIDTNMEYICHMLSFLKMYHILKMYIDLIMMY